jgi:hypothetical protein
MILVGGVLFARPAHASFHLMQIEQVIAGVDGSTATQAIQMRFRASNQNLVSFTALVAYDATGSNPVVLLVFPSNVSAGPAGSNILVATSGFSSSTNPPVTPDFTLTNRIPDSYLAAGSLTYEDKGVLWRICWGGANYTGPTNGIAFNDSDGDCAPSFPGPLPSTTKQALLFQFGATALGSNSAADYALTTGPAVFTNKAGASGTIAGAVSVPGGPAQAIALSGPIPNPVHGPMSYSVILPSAMRVEVGVYDLAGRRVLGLVDGTLPAGRSGFTWNPRTVEGSALRAGVYFLGMTVGGVRRTARFVLVGRGAPPSHEE